MKNQEKDLDHQLQSLLGRLREAEDQEGDLSSRLGTCICLCIDCLRQLRHSIADHGFPDSRTEIYFFKHIKPVIVARCRYYQGVHQLHLSEWKGCRTRERERLTKELEAIGQVFERHQLLWQYYRSGSKALDEQFFLRGKVDWQTLPFPPGFDELFSTCCDEQLAELLAMEQLMQYIDQRLQENDAPHSQSIRGTATTTIRCTATATEIIELGYALYLVGFFDNGKASIRKIMDHLQETWQVDLSNYYHTFAQLAERKQPARFLNRLLQQYNRYLNSKDD